MLLGLTGKAGSGKDTVAAYLVKEHGYERRAFADILKRSAAALLGIDPLQFEELKNDPKAVVDLQYRDPNVIGGIGDTISTMTVREFLQRYGTESHRDVFGNYFWVDQLLPVGGFYAGRKIVISDCRYQSEVDRITQLQGYIVRLSRPLEEQSHHRHSSEAGQENLKWNHILHNTGTLEELYSEVDTMLEVLERDAK